MKKISSTKKEFQNGIVCCKECGETDNYRNITTDSIDNIETEKERICNGCGGVMDWWEYGYWQKESEDNQKESENKP